MKKVNLYKKKTPHVKKCAVILKDDLIIKIYDYPALFKELNLDPNIIIYEDCDESKLDEKAAYWDRIVHYNLEEVRKLEELFLKRISLNTVSDLK